MKNELSKELLNQINSNEIEYLNSLKQKFGLYYIEKKIENIKNLLTSIDLKPIISLKDFEEIRKIAISKGGFLLNSFRREFYKKAFNLSSDNLKFIYLKKNHFKEEKLDYNEFYSEEFYSNLKMISKKKDYDYFIEVDVKRTMANYFFNADKYQNHLNGLKINLINFLKNFFILNKDYHYYQGFHDIAMYVYILFNYSETFAMQMLQRISEFYLKDYIVELNQNEHFKFENVFKLLNMMIRMRNKSIATFINDFTSSSDPIFSLPWIITVFTHDIKDFNLVLRIFDFVLFSHPYSIYNVSSNVCYINLI